MSAAQTFPGSPEPTTFPLTVAAPLTASPACSASRPDLGPCPVCPHLVEQFEPFRRAAYWEAMHHRALRRQGELEQQIAELKAQLRLREQQLFGKSSEATARSETNATKPSSRPRGQQKDKPGPKRRDHSHLPVVEQVLEMPVEQQACPACHASWEPFPGTEDSEVLEIDVRAYRRRYRRRRYRPTCTCGQHAGIVTAPPADKVIPKSILGVSIWVEVLLDKFLFYRPTYRLLADWQTHGLDLSLGTVTDGLHRLVPLFEPLYQALIEHNQQQEHWHADETRWLVFTSVEGKVGHRWVLWVFHAADVVVFVLATGRAHDVPEDHFEPVQEGILSVDRYAAYKAMKQVKDGLLVLAFCWAHVRRDFLGMARSWPDQEAWALAWVERIGELYQRNDARREAERQSVEFVACDQQVRQHVEAMAGQAAAELAEPVVHPARQKVLRSLQEHWDGLTVFVDHPEVPLDNNRAERMLRGPVVGRKNYYGSGAVWAGELAAMLFSVLQTLCLWNLNPRTWLTAYLQACAAHGGKAPAELANFLPWQMPTEQRQAWSLEKRTVPEDSS